jgi:hypothetical protein
VGTIIDDDGAVTVTVDYDTADGTAMAGQDYEATSGTLTFASGEMAQAIEVAILDDIIPEPTERFFVNLSNPTNASLDKDQGVGTIIDDDPGVFAKGVGLNDPSGNDTSGVITLDIPDTSIRAFLTWQQIDAEEDGVDDTITLMVIDPSGNVLDTRDISAGLPPEGSTDDDPRRGGRRCFLADITQRIVAGHNTYIVSGVNNESNPGAGIVVVTSVLESFDFEVPELGEPLETVAMLTVGSGSGPRRSVEVKAGCDFFFRGDQEGNKDSGVVTFRFDPAPVDRKAKITLFVGDAQSTEENCPEPPEPSCRGNEILFLSDVGMPPSSLADDPHSMRLGLTASSGFPADGLIANDGLDWDTFGRNSGFLPPDPNFNPGVNPSNDPDRRGEVTILAGATFASFQILSPANDRGVSAIVSMAVFEILEPSGE